MRTAAAAGGQMTFLSPKQQHQRTAVTRITDKIGTLYLPWQAVTFDTKISPVRD